MDDDITPVLIIGGGPCGLLTSLLLARMGVPNMLVEKHPGISRHPKAMGLTRRTMELLSQQGLAEEVLEANCVTSDFALSTWCESLTRGEIFSRAEIQPETGQYTPCAQAHCPQTHLEAVLFKALTAEKNSRMLFGWQMTDFSQKDDGVEATLQPRTGGQSRRIQACYMVAADGAASGIRQTLGIETVGPGDMGHFLNVFFRAEYGPLPAERRSILYQAINPEYMEFFVAVNGHDLWLMHHFLQPGEAAADHSPEDLKKRIMQASGAAAIEPEIIGISPWVMSPKLAHTFRQGRVFLTGDASARLSPAGGLGMNTGLQSAQNLAWKLAAVINHGAGDALLDTYTRERHGVAQFTMDNSGGNAREIFDIITKAFGGQWDEAKDMMAHSRRKGAGLGQDLGLAYPEGAFVSDGIAAPSPADPVNTYIPFAGPGHRAPHTTVMLAGEARSTITLFGKTFVLLTGADGQAWIDAAQAQTIPVTGHKISDQSQSAQAWLKDFGHLYGISPQGAVLIRPDGYVAYRSPTQPDDPHQALARALRQIL